MGEFIDIPTIFFLVVAVVVLLRLRNVLGTRDGFEKPPEHKDASINESDADEGNVVSLPNRERPIAPVNLDAQKRRLKLDAEIERLAKGDEALAVGLNQIIEEDQSFSPKSFMDGAISAYEMVVVAYAQGDRKTLKMILDKQVYEGFESAIAERESRGETVDFTFVGFSDVTLRAAEVDNKIANVTIQYAAQVVSATKNADGELIDGDEEAVVNISDEWTFSRNTKSRDPNWKLISTNQLD
ncbi:Tim44/TimA family putative adaptor protein [Maritalea porphyrae]|uniref:Tim44/TimA family putative adaptor protein n=1 Tax=Maritalea porphyrae TaxID=880732 RepID=UPI0022B01D0D|nr:Tim44/TimA family putative adaptor protein [Maritalea porphyrae]MCZ4272249.1 Tim44/TimA family putative adaptor protein [Maritalea porphyrae]